MQPGLDRHAGAVEAFAQPLVSPQDVKRSGFGADSFP
jgi:hypothetical protein